jgi:hypothetical protein
VNATASTAHEAQLLETLALADRIDAPTLWTLVRKEGRFYLPSPLEDDWMRLEPRYCFDNATETAEQYEGLVYVEGYAFGAAFPGVPVHHAWNATEDGLVVDTTWDPVGVAYLGIVIPVDEARRARDAETSALIARYGW